MTGPVTLPPHTNHHPFLIAAQPLLKHSTAQQQVEEELMSVPELSVQLKNVPGQLVQITAILAEAGVNLLGISASATGKVAWVHMIVDSPKIAEEALEECGIAVDCGEAVAILMPHEPGSLDRALRVLADNRINLDYVYTCESDVDNRVMAILGVQTPGKIEKLLVESGVEVVR